MRQSRNDVSPNIKAHSTAETPTATPPHLPAEWASAIVTHCATHGRQLLERLPPPATRRIRSSSRSLTAHDPATLPVGQCRASLGLTEWPPDRVGAVRPRGQTPILLAIKGLASYRSQLGADRHINRLFSTPASVLRTPHRPSTGRTSRTFRRVLPFSAAPRSSLR
jgi:hypothetical protein